jgi:dolichol kinase
MTLSKEEINRKLLHILSGSLIPFGIFYIPKLFKVPNWTPTLILGILLFISLFTELIRFKFPAIQKLFFSLVGSMLRQEENKKLTGATYIFGSGFLCTIFFYDHPHISFMVISMFIFGDAVAAIVGLSIGKIKIGKKSLEGSLACFFLCLIMCFFVFPHIPELLNKWDGYLPLPLVLLASLSITVFELFPLKISKNIFINDNLSVPILSGLIMLYVYPLF